MYCKKKFYNYQILSEIIICKGKIMFSYYLNIYLKLFHSIFDGYIIGTFFSARHIL